METSVSLNQTQPGNNAVTLPLKKEPSVLAQKISNTFASNKFTRGEKREFARAFSEKKWEELAGVLTEFFSLVSENEVVMDSKTEMGVEEILDDLETFIDLPHSTEGTSQGLKSAKYLQQLAELIPLEKLQKIVQKDFQNVKEALDEAKGMIRAANRYLEMTESPSPPIKARLLVILSYILTFLDSIISTLGVADFFKPPEGDLHSDFKMQKIFMLLSLFTFLTATLLPLYGVTTGSSIVGGVMLLIAVISLIWPKIRPTMPTIPEGKNWTADFRESKLRVLGGRENFVDEAARVLITNKKVKSVKEHVLITGPSGIGKTELGKNLVQAIERGDYPELKGMEVLYFNTADLVASREMLSGQNKILKRMAEVVKQRQDNVIIILDEVHLACQKKEDSVMEDQLKTVLDSDFPYVVAFTTEEEFARDIYESSSAFIRRFDLINIGSTDSKDTKEILQNFFLQNADKGVLIEDDVWDYIIEKTKNEPQPLSALKILSRCLRKTIRSQQTPLDQQIREKQGAVRKLDSNSAVASFSKAHDQSFKELLDLKTEFKKLVVQWKDEKKKMGHLFHLRDLYGEVKVSTFHTVKKVKDLKEGALLPKDKTELAKFMMLRFIAGPALEKAMTSQAKALKIHSTISRDLVDVVLKEKKEKDQRVQELVKRGRDSLNDRKKNQ